jgi:ABC-type protease/lipase transport system fused ATPase/permease subunit
MTTRDARPIPCAAPKSSRALSQLDVAVAPPAAAREMVNSVNVRLGNADSREISGVSGYEKIFKI